MYSSRHGQITNYDNDWTIREINYANEQRKRIVFINIDGSPLTKWFLFMYAQKQQVDGSSEVAIDSLISDLAEWLGIERQDVRKAQEEAERKAKEEAERKAQEEAERKVQEEAERRAKEEAERKTKGEAEAVKKERDAREAAVRKVAEAAKSFDQKGEEERTRRAYLRIAESEEQKKLLKNSLPIALGVIVLIGIIIGISSKGGSSSDSSIDSLSNSLSVNTSNVKAATYSNGHEYVDLGLSVKWATCNVGANKSEDYGDYYAWGETETKSNYDWSTYKWMESGYSDWKHINKYTLPVRQTSGIWYNNGTFVGDNKIVLDPEDDVARVMWGGDWRIPTDAEREELLDINNCTWTWTTQGGKNGYLVTSKKNGNSIFLPAAGCRNGSSLYDADSCGYYWSSSLGTYGPCGTENACCVYFNSDIVDPDFVSRTYGQSVRPVCP